MKNNSVKLRLRSFSSIDRRCPVGEGYARELVNYRLMPDASIKKRDGYVRRLQLPDKPSCISPLVRKGEKQLMAIAGNRVYSIDLAAKSYKALSGTLPSVPAKSCIFNFRDRVFLLDGKAIREVNDSGISQSLGYVPLYGRNWHPKDGGEVYEPRNLLNNHIRILYRGVSGQQSIYLPSNVSSIVRVEINGAVITNYSKNNVMNSISSTSFSSEGAEIMIWYTLSDTLSAGAILNSCTVAEIAGGGDSTVIFCTGSASSPHTVFRSVAVSDESVESARVAFSGANDLYFPCTGEFSVGSDDLPVTSLVALGDQTVIYNTDEAWLVSVNDEKPSQIPVPEMLYREIGCSSVGAAVICGEYPATLCGRSVYLWEPDLESYNDLIAICISDPVSELISDELASRGALVSDRDRRELWLFDPQGDEGSLTLIYNRDSKCWYTYTGVPMELAFWHDGYLCGVKGNAICVFDSASRVDSQNGADTAFTAVFGSPWLDLDCPESLKLSRRLSVTLEGEVTVELEYDNGKTHTLSFRSSGGISTLRKRLPKERFRQIRISIRDGSTSVGRVFGLTLEADLLEKTP